MQCQGMIDERDRLAHGCDNNVHGGRWGVSVKKILVWKHHPTNACNSVQVTLQ